MLMFAVFPIGAAVISSSSGNEYSLEGEQWKNDTSDRTFSCCDRRTIEKTWAFLLKCLRRC